MSSKFGGFALWEVMLQISWSSNFAGLKCWKSTSAKNEITTERRHEWSSLLFLWP
jgi:hypothetical protein